MIDWDRVPPGVREVYEAYRETSNREANLESLKMLKSLKRSIVQDGILNDFEPQSLDEIDELIERVIGRLT